MPRAPMRPVRRWIAAAGALLMSWIPTTAMAQSAPVVLEPQSQSGVVGGSQVTVRGTDCEPGSAVELHFNGTPAGTTTAAADGTWASSIEIPTLTIDPTVEEAAESSIRITCADAVGGVVVVYQDPLARSGLAVPVLAATITAGGLMVAGVALLARSRRRT